MSERATTVEQKCEFKYCKSGKLSTVRVNENIGDASYSAWICEECAELLNLKSGSDISYDVDRVNKALRKHYG